MEAVETYEHEGVKVEIHYDDGDGWNPREMENVETLVCWHPDYTLGDYQFRSPNGRGSIDNVFETDRGRTDFASMEVLYRYLSLMVGAKRITPLYLYDHSGITMRAGSPSPYWMDAAGWDTTMVGFAFCTEEVITKCCGEGEAYRTDEWIDEAIRIGVEEYDKYLRGECFGFIVDPDGPDEESCWGFLGFDSVEEEANGVAKQVAKERVARARRRGRGLHKAAFA